MLRCYVANAIVHNDLLGETGDFGANLPDNAFEKMAEKAMDNGLGYVGGHLKSCPRTILLKFIDLQNKKG